jgi:hypothetical protein
MEPIDTEEHKPPPRAQLDSIARGSMVKVVDPENRVWYWVIIERRLKDHSWFVGRIDAHCIGLGPSLRHGGTVTFHEDNILFVWPIKVKPVFDRRWFRIVSDLLSLSTGVKALKRPTVSAPL